jgi:hypothetical protein
MKILLFYYYYVIYYNMSNLNENDRFIWKRIASQMIDPAMTLLFGRFRESSIKDILV